MNAYIIGIDLGTSGTKTVLFDASGKTVASATREYPLYQPNNGWAEQDADDWISAAFATVREVLETSGVASEAIAGVGISGQMHGLVMLDEHDRPLRKSIIWCDQRTGAECGEITRRVGAEKLIEITANPALTGFTASKILWVRNNEPDVYAKCKHILLPKDYLRLRLTGDYATEVSDASGMQLLDVPNRCWSDEVLDALEIDKVMLGKVYESPEVTGVVNAEAAELCGLAVGTPVVGGAGDNAAAAVGVGAVLDGTAFTTIGSSGVVYAHTSKLAIDAWGRVHTFCCAVPGAWHVMGVTQGAGLSMNWLKHTLMPDVSYPSMDGLAAASPIGSNRLVYLPYLMGERTPHLNPDCRGVLFGLSAMHTRGDIIRAVMEGVTFSLVDCLDILREMNVPLGSMLACGGGARSDLWRGMLADAYGLPVATAASPEGPALGVAILAAVGAGIYSDVQTACAVMTGSANILEPNTANHAEYNRFHEIYKALYPALKANFTALAEGKN